MLIAFMNRQSTAEACKKSGMPETHAACFQQVADIKNCVIASRSVGRACTGLILEGYASKGFLIKAKSCDWGPMAGFVMADPRFSKLGTSAAAVSSQSHSIDSARSHGAGDTKLLISDHRRKELEAMRLMTPAGSDGPIKYYSASSSHSQTITFSLIEEPGVRNANGSMWGVYEKTSGFSAHKPISALTNPNSNVLDYKSAITGDYDLWGVFPPTNNTDPNRINTTKQRNGQRFNDKLDTRAVPGSGGFIMPRHYYHHGGRNVEIVSKFPENAAELNQTNDNPIDNVTKRVTEIRSMLNGLLRTQGGYSGGDMVHHGDEMGRSGVQDPELKFIAFIPKERSACFIETLSDLREFIAYVVGKRYHVQLNPGWSAQLGFGATPGGLV